MINLTAPKALDMMHVGGPNLYVAPDGVEGEPCRCVPRHSNSGPTGRRGFMITAETCRECGRYLRSLQDLTWRQYVWCRRWNERCERDRVQRDSKDGVVT